MKQTNAFTIIELVFIIVVFGIASILFFQQKNNIEIANRDNQRKIAINAVHYALKKVYFEQNKAYPATVDSSTLISIDPDLLKDPDGHNINSPESTYKYEPTGCLENLCSGYTLRADLEKEADYTKTNSN